jgi:hypothetical protein
VISECPHCHSAVLLSPAGECPACRKNVNDLAGTDPNVTRVTIDSRLPLPSHCIICGTSTRRTLLRTISRPRSDGPAPQFLILDTIKVVFLLLQLLYRKVTRAGLEQIVFHLPICQNCHELNRQISISHVDWDGRRATMLAHVSFARQLSPTPRGYHSS